MPHKEKEHAPEISDLPAFLLKTNREEAKKERGRDCNERGSPYKGRPEYLERIELAEAKAPEFRFEDRHADRDGACWRGVLFLCFRRI